MKWSPIKIIRKPQQQTALWSGGTSTQLFIYPEHAQFEKRDFLFRISTATVETATSIFTSLPGINRILMVLKGELQLNHQHQYSKTLHTFDIDVFDGGWDTHATGKVIDFNILFKPTVTATCSIVQMMPMHTETIKNDAAISFGYLYAGKCLIEIASQKHEINPSDFVVFHSSESYTITSSTESYWVIVHINL